MNTANALGVQCVGFIMDGNRRWAEKCSEERFNGHLHGYKTLKKMIRVVHQAHIPHMVCYAFSTENWNRPVQEVSFLTELMRKGFGELRQDDEGRTINYRIIGQVDRLPADVQEEIRLLESGNHESAELTVWIGLSYGGRAEIIRAVNRAVTDGKPLTEESFTKLLWTHGMPDPDLIIRTSGEQRISNFLLWQSAYSEYVFTPTLWPDFGEDEFQSILEQYAKRQRRKGS
jgi:undecaprenyl diphosphate synthase